MPQHECLIKAADSLQRGDTVEESEAEESGGWGGGVGGAFRLNGSYSLHIYAEMSLQNVPA